MAFDLFARFDAVSIPSRRGRVLQLGKVALREGELAEFQSPQGGDGFCSQMIATLNHLAGQFQSPQGGDGFCSGSPRK